MRRLLIAALLAATPVAAVAAAGTDPYVIYGPDSRREVFGLRGARATAADSTVALVDSSRIVDNRDGTSRLATAPLSAVGTFCPGERFLSQPVAARCSGVLLAPDIVATAGHCITSGAELARNRFVFGFRLTDATTVRTTLRNSEIYRGARILARQDSRATGDYAVIQLDRQVVGHAPLRLASGGPPAVGTSLYLTGHPLGLPAKISDGARVNGANAFFFGGNLDAYNGNSGSPVFDGRTNVVLGLLSADLAAFVRRGNCLASNRLPDSAGATLVTNASAFARFVPRR